MLRSPSEDKQLLAAGRGASWRLCKSPSTWEGLNLEYRCCMNILTNTCISSAGKGEESF